MRRVGTWHGTLSMGWHACWDQGPDVTNPVDRWRMHIAQYSSEHHGHSYFSHSVAFTDRVSSTSGELRCLGPFGRLGGFGGLVPLPQWQDLMVGQSGDGVGCNLFSARRQAAHVSHRANRIITKFRKVARALAALLRGTEETGTMRNGRRPALSRHRSRPIRAVPDSFHGRSVRDAGDGHRNTHGSRR